MADQFERYATAVVSILSRHVPHWEGTPLTVDVITGMIARQAANPSDAFELIVDDPGAANWRLLANSADRRRVRLHCFALNPRRDYVGIEETVNSLLDGLQLEGGHA